MTATLDTDRLPEDAWPNPAAAALDARPDAARAARRGPFRPEVWRNTRKRRSTHLAAFAFHFVDIAMVWGLALLALTGAEAAGKAWRDLIHAPLSEVLPLIVGAAVIQGLSASLDLYRFSRGRSLGLQLVGVLSVATVGAAAAAVTALILTGEATLRIGEWAVAAGLTLCGLHMIWFGLVARWRRSGALTPNVVVVGATRHAEHLIVEALKRRDLNVLGVFDDRLARSPDAVAGVPVLGRADDLLKHRLIPYVDRIVLAIDPAAQARVRELSSRLQVLPTELSLLVDLKGDTERDAALQKLTRAPLSSLRTPRSADRRAFNKRVQDLVLGVVALFVTLPFMALIALAVRVDSPGPIIFRQRRHGFNHEEIVVWKFRTMQHASADATAARQVVAHDDRITPVGRFLRSTSLDELPQLLNVLKGEMSLVGPRPHAIGMKTGEVESAALVADYAHRHRMKPGMTGWAAVKGSRGPLDTADDVRRRVQLDIDYIERQSLWLDVWIMAVTLPVLLGDRVAVR